MKHEEEVRKALDYESLYREAMERSQQDTYNLLNSSLKFDKGNAEDLIGMSDDETDIPLGIFNGLNGF